MVSQASTMSAKYASALRGIEHLLGKLDLAGDVAVLDRTRRDEILPPTVIGIAGNSARRHGLFDRAALPVFTVIALVIVLRYLPFVADAPTPGRLLAYAIGIASGLAVNFKNMRELHADYRGSKNWLQGAEGEHLTGMELNKLPEGYVVFHDFHPAGKDGKLAKWNWDHIVIGPTGVFIVETKNYSASRVQSAATNKHTKANVRQVQRVAAEFKSSLVTWSGGELADLFVVPLLVYTQPGAYVEKTQEKQVRVIPLKWLASDITSWKGRSLNPDQVYRISRVLFGQLESHMKNDYSQALSIAGEQSKRFRLERVAERGQEVADDVAVPQIHCPECGGQLVRRVAKRGPRTGKPFLGCENFARTGCRFALNLEQ
ncbi:MAG: NERD domain-containing protein [Anaerosomatales bacterium]